MSPLATPSRPPKKAGGGVQSREKSRQGSPSRKGDGSYDPRLLDIAALNLTSMEEPVRVSEPPSKVAMERGKLLEVVRRALGVSDAQGKKSVSLVVIGEIAGSVR